MKPIYLDHNATAPLDPRVLETMLPYFTRDFGNPSSLHSFGRTARQALEAARAEIARQLNARESEIVFLSGGTEANNLALRGYALQHRERGHHIIASRVEHPSVLNTLKALEKEGFECNLLATDRYGRVDPQQVATAIRPETILISIMHANNEVGTLNPVGQIGALARERGIAFHCDAVQTFGKLSLNVQTLPVDLLTISAHKIYGPKGVGALYVRRGVSISPQLYGGSQEQHLRAGSENLPGIAGFAEAARLMGRERDTLAQRIGRLRDEFQATLQQRIPDLVINGHPEQRIYNTLNISIPGCPGDMLLLNLDMKGIAVSTGSACNAGKVKSSHVLTAMGLSSRLSGSALRFSLGRDNTREEIDYVVTELTAIVQRLRSK